MSGILAEQALEPRRTRADGADDNDRGLDLLFENLRMSRDERLCPEACHEIPDHSLELNRTSSLTEKGLVLE